MRVLITGAEGLLGSALNRAFAGRHELQALGRAGLDITDRTAVVRVVAEFRPEAIVNCAAYNNVDGAEDDPAGALSVNALGVLTLARAARDAGSTLIHYSTDFVFDGVTTRPYTEDDAPNPQSVYASSKLLGEWLAADVPRHYVVRVESLFGPAASGPNAKRGSLGGIIDRIRRNQPVPVFVDRTVSPSFTPDVAAATERLLVSDAPAGLYHCVNDGVATWLQIAQEAARLLDVELHAQPLTLETVSLKARRPKFCALSPARLRSQGIVMPAWQDALGRHLGSATPNAQLPTPS